MFSEQLISTIENTYEKRRGLVPAVFYEIEEKIDTCTKEEQILLRYLYGNMPVSDMVNYPFETFLDYAKQGVFLWEKGLFKDKLDEETFCQYVVYHRVNTEDISPCRTFFHEKTVGEIPVGSSMEEATLALNYWCAQEASYRAADDRTASPMTVYTSGYGRCGEESVFAVSVLRSMGIPARQVYAPRWSHCDDNHAWVEVECNNSWRFIGACEPEEVLDKGWFLHASSRAQLIHSRWYGNIEPKDSNSILRDNVRTGAVLSRQGISVELNQTGRYANTRMVTVQVVDENGHPVQAAEVSIEILNYAEFFPVATLLTDDKGQTTIELGQGSCRVYVSKDGSSGFEMLHVEKEQNVTVVLGKHGEASVENGASWQSFECFAPKDAIVNAGIVTEEQKNMQKEKVAKRTAIRLQKTGTGNEQEVETFLCMDDGWDRKALLDTLTLKDTLDLQATVLEDHLVNARQYEPLCEKNFSKEIYVKYILAPRIEWELLSSYRAEIEPLLSDSKKQQFREEPSSVWQYITANINTIDEEEYDALYTLPGACLKNKVGNRQSQKILFVAICRTLGIPARLNPVDGAMEYYYEDTFVRVEQGCTATGTICLRVEQPQNFVYFQSWTVVKKDGDTRELLDLSSCELTDGAEVALKPGNYEILTANRLPNGNILGRLLELTVLENKTQEITLALEEAELSQMLEAVPVPSFELTRQNGEGCETVDLLTGNNHLVIWMAPGQEPTEHILNELRERSTEFNQNGTEIYFIVDGADVLEQATINKTMKELDHVRVLYDSVEERVNVLGRRFYVDPESIPLILVTNSDAQSVYAASGYNVGTADMILKILNAAVMA